MFVKPVKGKLIRDPDTMNALPESGILVSTNLTYWRRREMDGSIEIQEKPPGNVSQKTKIGGKQ